MSESLEIYESSGDKNNRLSINRRLFQLIIVGSICTILILSTMLTISTLKQNGAQLLQNTSPHVLDYTSCRTSTFHASDYDSMGYVFRKYVADWISDSVTIHRNVSMILTRNVITNNITVILNVMDLHFTDYKISPDFNYILLSVLSRKNYRYSTLSKYIIYNIKDKSLTNLTDSNLQFAEWFEEGNGLVYIKQHNVFYRTNATSVDVQVTFNGLAGTIYNGLADWVYEEEVFSSSKAIWPSPRSQYVAYMTFNDSSVGVMTIPYYRTPEYLSLSSEVYISQYPGILHLRYPKPGTPNPIVDLFVHHVGLNRTVKVPESDLEYSILSHFLWLNESAFMQIKQNRIQNKCKVIACRLDLINVSCVNVIQLEENHGWLNIPDSIKPIRNGQEVLIILSQPENKDTFGHIVKIRIHENAQISRVTRGKYVVKEIVAVNENDQLIYYLATSENDAGSQHLYSVNYLKPENVAKRCLSCPIRNCTYTNAKFSTNFTHFLLHCLGHAVPEDYMVMKKSYSEVIVRRLTNNAESMKKNSIKNPLPSIKIVKIPIVDGLTVRVRLQIPPNADLSGAHKYPLLVHVYGGPNSNLVKNSFRVDFNTYMAAKRHMVVAEIDSRGSGSQGDAMLFSIYKKLGSVEIFDQINITRYLQDQLPYIDKTRTAIWGWSYGGYSAAMALIQDPDEVFKCGASVAPVTDWRLYDSIYTERYLGLETEEDGTCYVNSSLITKTLSKIKSGTYPENKHLFLAHGLFDDNVHYQQSMNFIKILELANVQFELHSYPDEEHSLKNTRLHLYTAIDNFLAKCFHQTPC